MNVFLFLHVTIYCGFSFEAPRLGEVLISILNVYLCGEIRKKYRVIALILVNIVPSWDIEGRKLVSVRRFPIEGQYSPISV